MTDTVTQAHQNEPLPAAALDDPHMLPYAKNPKRAEWVIGVCLFVGLLGFAGYGATYWQGGQTEVEGALLGIGLFGFGFGMSAWGKYLLPQGPFSEDRHDLRATDAEIKAVTAAVTERGKMVFRRRGFLGGLLAAGGGVMTIVLGFPLLRSLGPQPGKSLEVTNWKRGDRLVDINGRAIHSTDMEVGGALTVFPEGFVGSSVDQTMLLRAESTDIVTRPGRETWGPKGYLAYSKLCTHAGCPVGLYQEQTQQLLCPCHQSVFEVLDGGQQVFGPALRPLPQLAIMIDQDGWIRAQGPYDQPVGPGFWERS